MFAEKEEKLEMNKNMNNYQHVTVPVKINHFEHK